MSETAKGNTNIEQSNKEDISKAPELMPGVLKAPEDAAVKDASVGVTDNIINRTKVNEPAENDDFSKEIVGHKETVEHKEPGKYEKVAEHREPGEYRIEKAGGNKAGSTDENKAKAAGEHRAKAADENEAKAAGENKGPVKNKAAAGKDIIGDDAENKVGKTKASEPAGETEGSRKIKSKKDKKAAEHPEKDEGFNEDEEPYDEESYDEEYDEHISPDDEEAELLEIDEAEREKEEQRIVEEERRAREAKERERKKEAARAAKTKEKARKKEARKQKKLEKKKYHEEMMKRPEYRRMRRFLRAGIGLLILIVLIFAAIFLIRRYVRFSNYNVVSNIDMTNVDEHTQVYKFQRGYIKCAGDGITYFDKSGMIWSESFSMAEPLCDVCGEYIAVVDMKSTEVYVFGTGGLLNKISLTRNAINVEVSKYGSVAVVTNEGESNYIEIKDQDGSELVNIKTVFSSTGYLSDISLSPDGTKLAASFISVADGAFGSKVIFYDFSGDRADNTDFVTGQFEQYEEMLVTSVEFMRGNKVAAVCDSGFTIYSVSGKPEVEYEDLAFDWQIQSLFFSDRYVGFIVENSEGEDPYAVKVFNTGGKLVFDQPFSFAYNKVDFAGTNVILYSDYDCDVYNFAGTHKFSYTFDNRIYALKPMDDGVNYIMLNSGQTQFIKLR